MAGVESKSMDAPDEVGRAYVIAPGHEAWVVGDELFVGLEFKCAAQYAKG